MSRAVYTPKQIQAASYLLEIFAPPDSHIEALKQNLIDIQAEIDDEEAPVYALLYQVLGKDGAFFSAEDDSAALIESLKRISQAWEANLLFGARDWEGDEALYDQVEDILACAAAELRAYDLCLWQWDYAEGILAGFVSRLQDADLVEKLSIQCGADLWQVEEMES